MSSCWPSSPLCVSSLPSSSASKSPTAMSPEELKSLISQGVVRQVAPEEAGHKVLWTDGKVGGWFNKCGYKIKEDFSPSMRDKHYAHGHGVPKLRSYGNRRCHILMGVAFYGKRPYYKYKNGNLYPGIAHHLINDLSDYSKDNLLCWLTREQHSIADDRRSALEAAVPDGDLHIFTYDRLRELQNPRTMTDEVFQTELAKIRDKYKKCDPKAIMDHDLKNHCEI